MAAMAEGAIEGTRMDYRVSSPRSADFRFSRFGAKPGTTRLRKSKPSIYSICTTTSGDALGIG